MKRTKSFLKLKCFKEEDDFSYKTADCYKCIYLKLIKAMQTQTIRELHQKIVKNIQKHF